ncbi:MAG TPA: helix-turn-helix domain-containing protein [Dehalococcoidia bacterium]|nr:helix-turn-helix domain-containing protein [Dehalococcoidia bacterium]
MSDKILLTVPEAAERLGVGRSFLYGIIQRGDLPSIKLGRARRVSLTALESFVARLEEAECTETTLPEGPPTWPTAID